VSIAQRVASTTATSYAGSSRYFPPTVWNVHDLVPSDVDGTNNLAEAWNSQFETPVGWLQ